MGTAALPLPPELSLDAADRWCAQMLPKVSRTFALNIRFLPSALERAVRVAYLLCRIADTIEDDGNAEPALKADLLDRMLAAFDGADAEADFLKRATAIGGASDHVALVRGTGIVLQVFRDLPLAARDRVRHWVTEMVVGMKKFVLKYPRGLRIESVAEYQEYCWYVAGTVGHMLTDLWRAYAPRQFGAQQYDRLLSKAKAFGEALQTVNILKDIAWDAEHENAIYIPGQTLRAHGSSHETILSPAHEAANHAAVREYVQLAKHDLDAALEYTLNIPRRHPAIRMFCILPLLMAQATLRDLEGSRAMLRRGGTVKISRREVKALLFIAPLLVMSNAGLRWLTARVRRKPFGVAAVSSA
jgi:farnesyl-diphosphate farnesyltransferase